MVFFFFKIFFHGEFWVSLLIGMKTNVELSKSSVNWNFCSLDSSAAGHPYAGVLFYSFMGTLTVSSLRQGLPFFLCLYIVQWGSGP